MKHVNYALLLCAAATLAACSTGKNSKDTAEDDGDSASQSGYKIEKVSYKDSVTVGNCMAFADCSIEYIKPSESNTALVDSTDAWTRRMLGVDKSVEMGSPLARYVVDSMLGSSKEGLSDWVEMTAKYPDSDYPPMSYEFSYTVKPTALAPDYVTMGFNSFIYTGGAHGSSASICQTFAAENGQPLTLTNMFKPDSMDAVLALVEQGLMKQFFQVNTKKEFRDALLLGNEPLPLPSSTPYFEDGGVCFLYQQYEIAPYASGMPSCVIPFEKLKPYFSDLALKLIDK